MHIYIEVDYAGLAERIHSKNEEQLRYDMEVFPDITVRHLKSNPQFFTIKRVFASESWDNDDNSQEIFLKDSISSIIKQLQNMSTLLDNLKAADDQLHSEVAAIGAGVTDTATRVTNDLAALKQQVADATANGTLNTNDLQTEIGRIQGDASTLADTVKAITAIDPVTTAPATGATTSGS